MSEEICTDGPVFYRFLYICFILDWIGLDYIAYVLSISMPSQLLRFNRKVGCKEAVIFGKCVEAKALVQKISL